MNLKPLNIFYSLLSLFYPPRMLHLYRWLSASQQNRFPPNIQINNYKCHRNRPTFNQAWVGFHFVWKLLQIHEDMTYPVLTARNLISPAFFLSAYFVRLCFAHCFLLYRNSNFATTGQVLNDAVNHKDMELVPYLWRSVPCKFEHSCRKCHLGFFQVSVSLVNPGVEQPL